MAEARDQLLSAAGRILESEGPAALQARRLAGEIGASTMAVYTHFGGMPGLLEALVRDGLSRFAAHIREAPRPEDPIGELIGGGLAYGEFAFQNPQLYRLMFGLTDPATGRRLAPTIDASVAWRMPEGIDAFSILLGSVERVIAAGDFRPQEPRVAAVQILSVTHGYILLELGGFLNEETQDLLAPLAINLMVGLGADREKTEGALARAVALRG